MTAIDYVAVEIDAPVGPSGATKTGRFEFLAADEGQYALVDTGQSQPLLEERFGQILALLEQISGSGESLTGGLQLDFGAGQHRLTLNADTPTDSQRDGSLMQWGSSSDPADGPNGHTATGAGPVQQRDTFMNYWRKASIDSRTPARLEYGEVNPDGYLEDHLDVVIPEPEFEQRDNRPSKIAARMGFIEIKALDDNASAQEMPR